MTKLSQALTEIKHHLGVTTILHIGWVSKNLLTRLIIKKSLELLKEAYSKKVSSKITWKNKIAVLGDVTMHLQKNDQVSTAIEYGAMLFTK